MWAHTARPALAALDPSLREELLEHAALIADDLLAHIHEGGADELPGSLAYEYDSQVLHNTRVRLLFADIRLAEHRIVLVSVERSARCEPAQSTSPPSSSNARQPDWRSRCERKSPR